MIKERYLEYLALDTILNHYMSDYSRNEPKCNLYLANNKCIVLDTKKLRARVTKLQKEFLEEYICINSTSKE